MKILHSLIISRSKIRAPIVNKIKEKDTSLISKWIKLRTSNKSHSWHFTRWWIYSRSARVLPKNEWMNEWNATRHIFYNIKIINFSHDPYILSPPYSHTITELSFLIYNMNCNRIRVKERGEILTLVRHLCKTFFRNSTWAEKGRVEIILFPWKVVSITIFIHSKKLVLSLLVLSSINIIRWIKIHDNGIEFSNLKWIRGLIWI